MSYVIQNVDEQNWAGYFKDQHIEVIVEFRKDGNLVDVVSPKFEILKQGTPLSFYILKPLSKLDPSTIGKYHATFLTIGLSAGDYTFRATGYYNNEQLVVEGSFTLYEVKRTQWFIDTLRGMLADRQQIEVPWEFWTHDPTKREWRDGQLYDCLIQALGFINALPPSTLHWTLDTVPCSSLVLLGAQINALLMKDIMEAHNYFDYSTPVRVSVYRGKEYRGIYSWIERIFVEPAKRFKISYTFNTLRPRAIVFPRIAFRVLRPLSMVLYFTSYGL